MKNNGLMIDDIDDVDDKELMIRKGTVTRMKRWRDTISIFVKNKFYMVTLSLIALCSYGFFVTHPTVGIDDTPYNYYFEEGLIAIVGRWCLYLLNKVVDIAEFTPFLPDLAAVLLLMAAAVVWSALFYSVLKDKVPVWGYLVFAGLFLSNSLHSEVMTYYLHNGMAIGYLFTGVSLVCLKTALDRIGETGLRPDTGKVTALTGAVLAMVTAIGCYESFMIVWLVGVLLLLLAERFAGSDCKVFRALCVAAVTALAAMILRSLIISAVIGIFDLGYMRDEAELRSITEMLSWISEENGPAYFAMVLKQTIVMYSVFGYAYFPIRIYVYAAVVLMVVSLVRGIMKKDFWLPVLTLGTFIASYLLVLLECKATYYRSAQFLPLVCAFAGLILIYHIRLMMAKSAVKKAKLYGCCNAFLGICFGILMFNQCSDMNKWFYVDYLKYEDAKTTMNRIAYELECNYDIEKPLIFTGAYVAPTGILRNTYVPYDSELFAKIDRAAALIDDTVLRNFYRAQGVWVAQTPALSVLDWGRYAFGDDKEMARFYEIHGQKLVPETDLAKYEEATSYAAQHMTHFPAKGSIADMGEYIIVNY